MSLIFVDCEASGGGCPRVGRLTGFGAVEYESRKEFYGDLRDPLKEDILTVFTDFGNWLRQFGSSPVFVSDNPAFDWQWINDGFWRTLGHNPFGHSARRIGDFYAGLCGDFRQSQRWKRLRITRHSHHPVDDARGNAEAFERMLKGER